MACLIIFIIKHNLLKVIVSIFVALSLSIFNIFFYFNNSPTWKYVIHAAGSIDGYSYLNSVQSFEYYLNRGGDDTTFELDFALTEDGKVFCSHEFEYFDNKSFENRPTYEEVISTKLAGKYDAITIDYLLNKLSENSQIKIVFDTKEADTKTVLEKIIDEANIRNINILNRFIVQVYNIENYYELQHLEFEEYWFTNYKVGYSPEKIIELFEEKNNITTYVMDLLMWQKFYNSGVQTNKKVAVHTINSKAKMISLARQGVDIIFSDFYL